MKRYALLAIGALAATGQGSWEENYHSNYFKGSYVSPDAILEPDVPPSDFRVVGWGFKRRAHGINYDYYYSEHPDVRLHRRKGSQLLREAMEDESSGRWESALERYRQLDSMSYGDAWLIRERIDLLSKRRTIDSAFLRRFFALRKNAAYTQADRKALLEIYRNPAAGELRANALYAYLASLKTHPGAAERYLRVAREFPRSERAEAALLMAARSLISEGKKPSRADLAKARFALSTLLNRYEQSRFWSKAIGWNARIDFLLGRYPKAAEGYAKQVNVATEDEELRIAYLSLADARLGMGNRVGAFIANLTAFSRVRDINSRVEALKATRDFANLLNAEDSEKVHRIVVGQTHLMPAYLDLRLYHYEQTRQGQKAALELARKAVEGGGHQAFRPALAARLAEISLRLNENESARTWANRSLSAPRTMQNRSDLALYVRGVASSRENSIQAARQDLEEVVRQFPESHLASASRERLALVYEKGGNWHAVLDMYLELGYSADFAFMVDVRVPIAELTSYARSRRPALDRKHDDSVLNEMDPLVSGWTVRDLLNYSIALRSLRKLDFAQAESALAKIKPGPLDALARPDWSFFGLDGEDDKLRDPRETLSKLKTLSASIARAKTPEEKADANYSAGQYIYRNRDLLFYNMPLWQSQRVVLFDLFYDSAVGGPDTAANVRQYMYEHECLSQARNYFLRIVKHWPNSKIAPKAMYSAAVATERLSNMNQWWRDEDERVKLSAKAVRLMRQLVRDYPTDPLVPAASKYADVWSGRWREH